MHKSLVWTGFLTVLMMFGGNFLAYSQSHLCWASMNLPYGSGVTGITFNARGEYFVGCVEGGVFRSKDIRGH